MLLSFFLFFFFKQKTAYDMRISDWSSDVCSSDLAAVLVELLAVGGRAVQHPLLAELDVGAVLCGVCLALPRDVVDRGGQVGQPVARAIDRSDALRRLLVLVGLGAGYQAAVPRCHLAAVGLQLAFAALERVLDRILSGRDRKSTRLNSS